MTNRLLLIATLCGSAFFGIISLIDPSQIFLTIGFVALAIVLIPLLLQRNLDLLTPWSFTVVSVFLGTTCCALCMHFDWPDPDWIERGFRLGEEGSFFVNPSLLYFLGLICLAAGFYWKPMRTEPRRDITVSGWSQPRVYSLGLVLLVVCLGATAIWMVNTNVLSSGVLSAKRTLVYDMDKNFNQYYWLVYAAKAGEFGYFLLLGYVLVAKKKKLELLDVVLILVCFLCASAVPFLGSRRKPILWMLLATMALIGFSSRKFPWLKAAALACIAMLIFQGMSLIRGEEDVSWNAENSTLSSLANSFVLNRNMADFTKTAHVIEGVPDTLPFDYGRAYAVWLIAPIPRSIWPEKPFIHNSLEVGVYIYGYQNTGIPPGLIAEAYWNFGVTGIVGVCLAFGFIMRLFTDRWYPTSGCDLGQVLIYVIGPMRMGFDALGHSFGFGLFPVLLNMTLMWLLIRIVRPSPGLVAAPDSSRVVIQTAHRGVAAEI